jgi:hypothetical protein
MDLQTYQHAVNCLSVNNFLCITHTFVVNMFLMFSNDLYLFFWKILHVTMGNLFILFYEHFF